MTFVDNLTLIWEWRAGSVLAAAASKGDWSVKGERRVATEELEFQEPEKTVSSSIKKNTVSNDVDEDPVAAERRDKVKDAMLHAWSSYEKYAWGMDELMVLHLSLTTYYSFLSNKHNLRWKLLLEYWMGKLWRSKASILRSYNPFSIE